MSATTSIANYSTNAGTSGTFDRHPRVWHNPRVSSKKGLIGFSDSMHQAAQSRNPRRTCGFFVRGPFLGGSNGRAQALPVNGLRLMPGSLTRSSCRPCLATCVAVVANRINWRPHMAQSLSTGIAAHIAVIDGQPTTTTQDIADVYGRRHEYVMKIVRQRIAEAGEWGVPNFWDTPYTNPQNGQTYTVIRMTKKGFHFVVGKFTGAKAVQHQIAFADEFERMEAQLLSIPQQLPPPQGLDARALLATQINPVPMPAALHKAIDKAAWRMAGEAHELARQHLARRVAYRHTNGPRGQPNLFQAEALADLRTVTLGDVLGEDAKDQMRTALTTIRVARDVATRAAAEVERQIAALTQSLPNPKEAS